MTVCLPNWGELWQSVIILDSISEEEGSATSSTFSSEESLEYHEHNVWNSLLDVLCHFEVGVVLGALLDGVVVERIVALTCHFSLDLLCDKTSSLPLVNDHVSVRNWPPPPYPHVATDSANVISPAAANEPALMQYVLDGSTWSFICPFLDLFDTFQHENYSHYMEFCSKVPRRCAPIFLVAQCTWT